MHDGFFHALFDRARNKRSLRDGFSTDPDTVFGAAFKAVTEVCEIFIRANSRTIENCCTVPQLSDSGILHIYDVSPPVTCTCNIYPSLMAVMVQAHVANKPIYICGHSLGGMILTHCSAHKST